MRILATTTPLSGCGYHRVVNPLYYVNGERHVTNVPSVELLEEKWDIFFYNRITPVDVDWERTRQLTGAKIVMDLDDYWVLPPGHSHYDEYVNLRPRIERNIREADAVMVTHARLAEKVYPLNKNVYIVPNALPYGDDQFTVERLETGGPVRLFWAGGFSHMNDIELLRNPMKRISHLNVNTVIGGYSAATPESKNVWDRMVSAYTYGLKISGKVLPGLPPDQYMNHYCFADVCLVPLVATEWNTYKSNLKLLEAACKKIPVICSHTEPYLEGGPPVFYVKNQKDWYNLVKHLVDDRRDREQYGQKLYEWAQQFDLKRSNRNAIFESICGSSAHLEVISKDGGSDQLSPACAE